MSSSARNRTLFEHPRLYDLAFGFRDFAEQSDGLLALARRYGASPVRAALELCCGPAHHLRELATRGIRAYGLDTNREMLAYARSLARRDGAAVELIRGDMRTFRLPRRVDLAYCLFDSFCHNTTDADAIATLRATAGALRRGGLFVAELTHPGDFFAGIRSRSRTRWTMRYPDVVISTRFAHTRVDPIEETFEPLIEIEARYRTGRKTVRIVDRLQYRIWLRSGLRHAAAASGCFDVVGWHGDLTPDVPLGTRDEAWQMVVVMRKR
ncbi:MAG: class I SAM-dependent methyltransferase [Candidatus Eremiobacteraeota bacterium]|nr:class I SAM-dependent methyltransferase [Candidatus Eremiobacteraeota bacterium]MBV8366620.1 class I SAM-dependent methyltransferase [Candidatus Eremiobacteraeota bacterium]